MQIGSLVQRAALYFADAPCLTQGNKTVSFREFDDLTNRLANALLALDLSPGDRVGVLLPNSIDCLVSYYAVAKAGLVRVGLNTRETGDEREPGDEREEGVVCLGAGPNGGEWNGDRTPYYIYIP